MILIGKNTAPLLTGSRSLQNLGPKTGNPTGCLEETPASSCKIYVYRAYILWPAKAIDGLQGLVVSIGMGGVGMGCGCMHSTKGLRICSQEANTHKHKTNKQKDKQQNKSSKLKPNTSMTSLCHKSLFCATFQSAPLHNGFNSTMI